MTKTTCTFSSALAAGALMLTLSIPASALEAGAGVSIGGGSGVNAGAGASIGGSGGVNAGAGATVGGSGGATAGVGVAVGDEVGAGVGVVLGIPGTPGTGVPGIQGVVARMSPDQLAQTKKQCRQIMADRAAFGSDLIALCKLVQTASR
ncbi:MAG: hypothetical protein NTV73_02485 [Hyphomicrobiales bacterium]|nr:hypothetical protein [Hyphomicrobiales bacterium]